MGMDAREFRTIRDRIRGGHGLKPEEAQRFDEHLQELTSSPEARLLDLVADFSTRNMHTLSRADHAISASVESRDALIALTSRLEPELAKLARAEADRINAEVAERQFYVQRNMTISDRMWHAATEVAKSDVVRALLFAFVGALSSWLLSRI